MKPQSISRNATVLYGAEVASRVLFVAMTILIARELGAGQLGGLIFGTSLAGIVQVVSDFGLTVYLVRALSKDPTARRDLLPSIAALRLAAVALVGAAALLYAWAVADNGDLFAVSAFAVGYIMLSAYSDFVFSLYRAEETMGYEARGKLLNSIAYAGGGIALVATGLGVIDVVAWSCVVALLTNVYAWWLYGRLSGFSARPRFRLRDLRRVLTASLPFGIVAVLTTVSFRIDSLMLGTMRGTHDVGLYGAAYRTMEFLLILPAILSTALLPVIARQIDSDPGSVLRLTETAIRRLWSLAFPLAAGLGFLGGQLLTLAFGGGFKDAHAVLALLGCTLIPLFASAMTAVVISAGPRPAVNSVLAAGVVVINVGLNLALIPSIGINGAGIATLVTESAGLVAGAVYIARTMGPIRWLHCASRPLIASGAMSALIVASGAHLAAAPVYAIAYVGVLAAIGGVTRDDVSMLRRALSPRELSDAVGAEVNAGASQ